MNHRAKHLFPVKYYFVFLLFSFPAIVTACSVAFATDPYHILHKHYRAIGGIERLQQIKTSFSEGKSRYDGLEGDFKHWEAKPLQYRTEQDYNTIKQVEGDSGQLAWFFDTNGQLLIHKDPEILKRREISKHIENFEHLKPASPYFEVFYQGITKVDSTECYEIRIINSINSDSMHFFFDKNSYLLVQSIVTQPDTKIISSFSDYRQQDGIVISFHQKVKYLPWEKEEETWMDKYVANPAIDNTIFEIPTPVKDYTFTGPDSNKKATSIPFQLIENLIYLPVTIGQVTTYWVLDSGASMSVIDVEYAHSLGMDIDGSIQGYGFGDLFKLSFVTVPQFSVGHISFTSQKFFGTEGLVQRSYEPVIHGILGYDFLSRFVVEIDYDKRLVTLHQPETFQYDGEGLILDAPLKYRTFTIEVALDNLSTSRWTLDLGAYLSSIHYQFAEKHNLLQTPGVETVSQGLSSISREKKAQFNCLTIENLQLDQPLLNIPSEKGKGATALGEVGGNLGNSTLKHFHLWLHYPNQQVILEKGANFNVQPPQDKSGLILGISEDDSPMVSFVARNTPAANAGIVAGDVIKKLNHLNITPASPVVPLRKLLRQQEDTEIHLQLLRENRILKKSFRLQKLYQPDSKGCSNYSGS